MSARQTRTIQSINKKNVELALAVPQVMAHRLTRMVLADQNLSSRDRKEFNQMSHEKLTAFNASWQAMFTQTMHVNQMLCTSFIRAMWSPWWGGQSAANAFSSQLNNAALSIMDKGLAPVHRTATANAKRLAKTKLR